MLQIIAHTTQGILYRKKTRNIIMEEYYGGINHCAMTLNHDFEA